MQVVMHDLLSGQAREIVRTVWDGKQPTALAFLYANSARLLGFVAGDNSNEIILGPVLAVGSAARDRHAAQPQQPSGAALIPPHSLHRWACA